MSASVIASKEAVYVVVLPVRNSSERLYHRCSEPFLPAVPPQVISTYANERPKLGPHKQLSVTKCFRFPSKTSNNTPWSWSLSKMMITFSKKYNTWCCTKPTEKNPKAMCTPFLFKCICTCLQRKQSIRNKALLELVESWDLQKHMRWINWRIFFWLSIWYVQILLSLFVSY